MRYQYAIALILVVAGVGFVQADETCKKEDFACNMNKAYGLMNKINVANSQMQGDLTKFGAKIDKATEDMKAELKSVTNKLKEAASIGNSTISNVNGNMTANNAIMQQSLTTVCNPKS